MAEVEFAWQVIDPEDIEQVSRLTEAERRCIRRALGGVFQEAE